MGKFFKSSKGEKRAITTERSRFMTIFNRLGRRTFSSRQITPPLIDNQLSPIMETDTEEALNPPPGQPQDLTPNIIIPEILHPQTLPPFENLRNYVSCPANLSTIPIQTQHPRPAREVQINICSNCEQHCPTTTICKHCPIHCIEIPIEESFYQSTSECVLFNGSHPSTSYRSTPIPLTSFDANLSSDFEQINLSTSDQLDMALLHSLNIHSQDFNPSNRDVSSRNSKSPTSSSERSTSSNPDHPENHLNTSMTINNSRLTSSNRNISSGSNLPIFDIPLTSNSNLQVINPPTTINNMTVTTNVFSSTPSTSAASNPFTQY